LQVSAGLTAHLVRDARNLSLCVEQEGQDAVVQAVGVALLERERQRCTREAVVLRAGPQAPGLEHELPLRMPRLDAAAAHGNQRFTTRHELEVKLGQVPQYLWCGLRGAVVVPPDLHRAEQRFTRQCEAPFDRVQRSA